MRPHLEEHIVQWKAQTKGHQGMKTTQAAVDKKNVNKRRRKKTTRSLNLIPHKSNALATNRLIGLYVYKIANLETWSSPRHSQKWLQSLELGKLPAPGHLMIFNDRVTFHPIKEKIFA